MKLHKKISLLTKKSGLPCGVIAKKLNIVSGTFSDWRSGKACPTFAHLKDLAEFFNLTLSELLHDVEETYYFKNYSTDDALIIIKEQIARGHGVRAKPNGKNLVTVSSSRPLP